MICSFFTLLLLFSSVTAFAPIVQNKNSMALMGIFDGFVKSMEGNYKGGDDSPYAKAKAADEKKRLLQKKKSDARKAKGYTKLADVKQKSFAKFTYEDGEKKRLLQKKKSDARKAK